MDFTAGNTESTEFSDRIYKMNKIKTENNLVQSINPV